MTFKTYCVKYIEDTGIVEKILTLSQTQLMQEIREHKVMGYSIVDNTVIKMYERGC